MSDARSSLVAELDADLEKFLKEKIEESKNEPRSFNFDNKSVNEIADEMKEHPVFMTEFDETKPMSTAMEALQALKYQTNDNDENATSYKEDGNKNFGRKKYRWAIDNYTAGLGCKPDDHNLICVLLTNRAAAHYHLGNYRSSCDDCIAALRHNPSHKKAWLRAIECNWMLNKHEEVIQWCDRAISKFPDDQKILEFKEKSQLEAKRKQRDARKLVQKVKKERKEKMVVVEAIKKRNIRFQAPKRNKDDDDDEDEEGGGGDDDDGWLKMVCQDHNGSRVELIDGVELQWPVMFLYPEYQQSDYIVAFHELSTFADHVGAVFGTWAEWDSKLHYAPSNLNIYYDERLSNGLSHFHLVPSHFTLLQVLCAPTFTLTSSLLTFFIFAKNCAAEEIFLRENSH